MGEQIADWTLKAQYPGSVCALCGKGIAVDAMIFRLVDTHQYCHVRCLSRPPDDDEGPWDD
jgi:hypothetical protein